MGYKCKTMKKCIVMFAFFMLVMLIAVLTAGTEKTMPDQRFALTENSMDDPLAEQKLESLDENETGTEIKYHIP